MATSRLSRPVIAQCGKRIDSGPAEIEPVSRLARSPLFLHACKRLSLNVVQLIATREAKKGGVVPFRAEVCDDQSISIAARAQSLRCSFLPYASVGNSRRRRWP